MAGQRERHDGVKDGRGSLVGAARVPLSLMLLAGTAPAALANGLLLPIAEGASDLLGFLHSFDLHNAAYFGLFMGLVAFSTTTALLLMREQKRSARMERRLRNELDALRGADDLAALLMGSERQLLVSWHGRDGEPRFQGDPSIVGDNAPAQRALAFGTWLAPADAAAVDIALEQLKQRGQGFRLTGRCTAGRRFVDVEGRTIGGRAILRLRDVTGDRAELMTAQNQLATARSDLRAMTMLLDDVAYPLWIRDQHDKLLWANQAYLRSVEAKDLDDAIARSLELLGAITRDEARRQRQSGTTFSGRVTAVVAGHRAVLDVIERPTSGGSAGIAVDVSELEAVRTDLQRQMDAHVRTLDQLPTAVAIFDGTQTLIFSNAAYQQLWGLDQAFLASRPTDGEVLDRLRAGRKLPEQADFRAWKADFLQGYRSVEQQETWWHLPDRRTLRVVINPNPQGGVTYLFDDVSERFELASQVHSLTRVQSETLDTLKEGVAVFGSDGRLKLHNRAFAEMWNLPLEMTGENPHIDTIIKTCRMLTSQDEPWIDIRGAVAGLADMRMGLTCRIERHDGSALDCTAQPLPDGATLLSFTDVTASVNVERALTERNDALERASRLRDEFVHHVSYELRSPLTNIIGFTQLLGDETVGALNPRQRDYADHIMRSSAALLAILNDILDLASIDTGSLELSPEIVDIRSTIEAAMRGLEDRLAESSLTVMVDTPDDIGTFVADGKRVRQILFNLLSNAVGFSSPGQTIRVSARKRGGEVIFDVKDQGRGIPPEIKARIFERFESHTLGTRHRGVGLGLSIVRSFVELHGGRIEVSSAPGVGTTITCIFPNDRHETPSDGRSAQSALTPIAAE
ncbi:PAS-domain containing protein [Microvirga sp. HBU67558]|uniref:sensor histidine kinase n=1 Tax=Microvirga TaxID=186650 RepID=UPI001B392D3D|nr:MULTISPECIES: PAS domain-containing sensor histidine kinase [unclassified Microvirga]MBQ0821331.1 PAS-domain containing protein [Microvirga sp. HBU67558]